MIRAQKHEKVLTFDTRGNDRQKEAARLWADSTTSTFVYGGSKNSGKSFLLCSLLVADALTYPDTEYFIARRKLNDLRKFTKASVLEVLRAYGVPTKQFKFDGMDNHFEFFHPGGLSSYIRFVEAKYRPEDPDFDRFGSMNMTRGAIEEAGEITYDAYSKLTATVGRKNNNRYNLAPKVLLTCNPSKNFLYTEFYQPAKSGTLPPYHAFVQALPTDNKTMTPEYYQLLDRTLRGADRERLLFGNWDFQRDERELIEKFEYMQDTFTAEYITPEFTGGALVTDLARKGRDRYLLVHVTGKPDTGVCIRFLQDRIKSDLSDVEKEIKLYETAHRVLRRNVISDADGIGQYLEDYTKGLTEFHGNAKPYDVRFKDLKSECGYKLAGLINAGMLRIVTTDKKQTERIKTELPYLRAKLIDTDASKLEIMKKPDIKALLGHSPDYLDVLIMSMLPYIRPEHVGMGTNLGGGMGYK